MFREGQLDKLLESEIEIMRKEQMMEIVNDDLEYAKRLNEQEYDQTGP